MKMLKNWKWVRKNKMYDLWTIILSYENFLLFVNNNYLLIEMKSYCKHSNFKASTNIIFEFF